MSRASAAAVIQAGITLVERFKLTTAVHAEVAVLEEKLVEHANTPDDDGDGAGDLAGGDGSGTSATQ